MDVDLLDIFPVLTDCRGGSLLHCTCLQKVSLVHGLFTIPLLHACLHAAVSLSLYRTQPEPVFAEAEKEEEDEET